MPNHSDLSPWHDTKKFEKCLNNQWPKNQLGDQIAGSIYPPQLQFLNHGGPGGVPTALSPIFYDFRVDFCDLIA
jgi:hypothetical protein